MQTTRRSATFVARGGIAPPKTRIPRYDDLDDTYDDWINHGDFDDASHVDDDDDDDAPPPCSEDEHDEEAFAQNLSLAPLTYINGRYALTCSYVHDNWPQYGRNYSLAFTISAPNLWATFKLGLLEGVMYFSELPSQSSYDPLPFKWRGRVAEGEIMYGDLNNGWIKFLGNGRIEGQIDYHDVAFEGWRRPGPATKSPIDAFTMQKMWSEYSQDEYERENEARWHR